MPRCKLSPGERAAEKERNENLRSIMKGSDEICQAIFCEYLYIVYTKKRPQASILSAVRTRQSSCRILPF